MRLQVGWLPLGCQSLKDDGCATPRQQHRPQARGSVATAVQSQTTAAAQATAAVGPSAMDASGGKGERE